MDLSRLRLGEVLSGSAAVGLVLALFLDWNRAPAGVAAGLPGPGSQSGWSCLGVVMLLLILAVVALALALVVTTAGRPPAAIPIGAAVLTTGAGIVVTVVLAIRVAFLEDSLGGAYLGLLLMALITVGGWLAMADERTHAPSSAAPDLPRRPPPPVEA